MRSFAPCGVAVTVVSVPCVRHGDSACGPAGVRCEGVLARAEGQKAPRAGLCELNFAACYSVCIWYHTYGMVRWYW